MKLALTLALIAPLAACATVTRGTNQAFTVETEPSGAAVSTSIGLYCPNTPCTFPKVERDANFTVTVSLPGYETSTHNVTHQTSGGGGAGMAGNVLLGGIIGAAIDANSGATQELVPNPLRITLRPVSGYAYHQPYGAPQMGYAPPPQSGYSPTPQPAYAAPAPYYYPGAPQAPTHQPAQQPYQTAPQHAPQQTYVAPPTAYPSPPAPGYATQPSSPAYAPPASPVTYPAAPAQRPSYSTATPSSCRVAFEMRSGEQKVCQYNCEGSPYAVTVGAADQCPSSFAPGAVR